jgi:hypothetical protein
VVPALKIETPPAYVARFRAPIARWSAWNSGVSGDAAPDVGFVEPLQRRRLSSLAKISLRVAHDCVHDVPDFRLVYASRHGELKRTTGMLEDLANGETLSPTAFSLSVPNATPGIYSILRENRAASTTVSSGTSSFGFGLIEASMQFASDPDSPVLLVYADEPVPDVYAGVTEKAETAVAIAVLLSSVTDSAVDCRIEVDKDQDSVEPQFAPFFRCLEQHASCVWYGEGRRWTWSFDG